jgi:hypothetical protein
MFAKIYKTKIPKFSKKFYKHFFCFQGQKLYLRDYAPFFDPKGGACGAHTEGEGGLKGSRRGFTHP